MPASLRCKKNHCFSSCLKVGEDRQCPSSVQPSRIPSYSAFLFYSGTSVDWVRPIHRLPIQMLISSKITLTDKPRITFDLMSKHPLAQSDGHIKLTFHLGYFIQWFQGFKEPEQNLQGFQRTRFRNNTSLLLCPLAQTKSQSKPKLIKWRDRLCLLVREARKYYHFCSLPYVVFAVFVYMMLSLTLIHVTCLLIMEEKIAVRF